MTIAPERITPLNSAPEGKGPVLYWMSRDQRADDNWALIHALETAASKKAPCAAVFCLCEEFLGAQPYHYAFLLAGLRETAARLEELDVPFFLLRGNPGVEIPRFA
ncbi:MAG TPA: deoxyribodipyrimidine photo-lyase, partial [Elusimicrobiales bacterium]|nr:deoxyribodipyrimidine photo-lyase [Elusimicrobiales bacterium]